MKSDVLLCQCGSLEHQLWFYYDDDSEYPLVAVEIHLAKYGFWKRLKYAIKYLFGYQSRYGAFDEMILKPEDFDKIGKVADTLERIYLEELNLGSNGQSILS